MTQISNKQQNWIILSIWVILFFGCNLLAHAVANGMKSDFGKHFSDTDWWGIFVVFLVIFSLLSILLSWSLVDWLGPEILLSERIEEAKEHVAESERELYDAQHRLKQLEEKI